MDAVTGILSFEAFPKENVKDRKNLLLAWCFRFKAKCLTDYCKLEPTKSKKRRLEVKR